MGVCATANGISETLCGLIRTEVTWAPDWCISMNAGSSKPGSPRKDSTKAIGNSTRQKYKNRGTYLERILIFPVPARTVGRQNRSPIFNAIRLSIYWALLLFVHGGCAVTMSCVYNFLPVTFKTVTGLDD